MRPSKRSPNKSSQSKPADAPRGANGEQHRKDDAVKWIAVLISAIAIISTAVTTGFVTSSTNENARETARASAEYLGENQQLNFLRTQRQAAYGEYADAIANLARETGSYSVEYPRIIDSDIEDYGPINRLIESRLRFISASSEA